MPEEKSADTQDSGQGVDLKASLDAINRNLTEKMDKGISDLKTTFESKIDAIKSSAGADDEQVADEEDAEDDGFVTKKDLKKVTKVIFEEATKKSKENAEKVFEQKQSRYQRDEQTAQDFPMLNKASKEFSEDFYREVEAEVSNKIKKGRSEEDPDLIYDAAAVVEKKWIRDGKYAPKNIVEKANQMANYREDNFNFSPTQSSTSGPNEAQIALANRLGLSKEKLAQHMKKIR